MKFLTLCTLHSHQEDIMPYKNYTQLVTSVYVLSVAMETRTDKINMVFFRNFQHFYAISGAFSKIFNIAPPEDEHQTSVLS